MPSRSIKDELRPEETPVENSNPSIAPLPPIQIQADPMLQEALVQVVKDHFEKSKQDRETRDYGLTSKGEKLTFTSMLKSIRDLYEGRREAKTVPWRHCSNRSLRIATSVLDMLHARLFPAVWNEDLIRWRPGEKKDRVKVERINKYMKWELSVNSPTKRFFDKWTKLAIAMGDVFTESFWEVEERDTGEMDERPITDETGNPLINKDGTKAVNSQKKIETRERSKSCVIAKDDVYFLNSAKCPQKDDITIHDEFPYHMLEMLEKKGKAINVTGALKTRLMDTVSVPPQTDPDKEQRLKELKIRNMPVKILRAYFKFDVDGDGFQENIRVLVSKDHDIYLGGVEMRFLTKSGMRPIDITKYDDFLDRVDSLEGEGVLLKIKELAEEVDAIFNQITDSNTLGILRPGFYDPAGDLDAPKLNLAPNKMTPVPNPGQNVFFPDFRIDVTALINALNMVIQFIERLTAASAFTLGKEPETVGGPGTATRVQTVTQSAETRFAVPAERLKEGAGRVVTQRLDLVQLNVPPGQESRILGEDGEPIFQSNEITDEGISGKFDAYILNDPAMGSKQVERELASMFYSVLLQNVIVGTDPLKIYKVTARFVRAHGQDPQDILGPAPSEDDIDSPDDENTLMIQGDFKRVRAQIVENHIEHIKVHQDLERSPSLQQIPENLRNEILEYNRLHIAEHQRMLNTMVSTIQNFGGQNGQPGTDAQGTPGGAAPNQNAGLANTQGAVGQALQAQRNGKVGGPQTP